MRRAFFFSKFLKYHVLTKHLSTRQDRFWWILRRLLTLMNVVWLWRGGMRWICKPRCRQTVKSSCFWVILQLGRSELCHLSPNIFFLEKVVLAKKITQIALSQPAMNYLALLLLDFSPLCLVVFFSPPIWTPGLNIRGSNNYLLSSYGPFREPAPAALIKSTENKPVPCIPSWAPTGATNATHPPHFFSLHSFC